MNDKRELTCKELGEGLQIERLKKRWEWFLHVLKHGKKVQNGVEQKSGMRRDEFGRQEFWFYFECEEKPLEIESRGLYFKIMTSAAVWKMDYYRRLRGGKSGRTS